MDPNLGAGTVTLPSRGVLYKDKLPGGVVSIRKLKVGEEHLIQNLSGMALVDALVSACTKFPGDFKAQEMILTDRLAVLIALRVFTFGPKYAFTYRCTSCNASNKHECNLAEDLTPKYADAGLSEPIELELPDSKRKVGLRFLRGKDEAAIAKVSKRVALQSNDHGDSSHVTRIVLQLVHIDGVEVDAFKREQFVRDMSMVDSIAISDALNEVEPGIDMTIPTTCAECGASNEVTLPFTGEFFRPSRRNV